MVFLKYSTNFLWIFVILWFFTNSINAISFHDHDDNDGEHEQDNLAVESYQNDRAKLIKIVRRIRQRITTTTTPSPFTSNFLSQPIIPTSKTTKTPPAVSEIQDSLFYRNESTGTLHFKTNSGPKSQSPTSTEPPVVVVTTTNTTPAPAPPAFVLHNISNHVQIQNQNQNQNKPQGFIITKLSDGVFSSNSASGLDSAYLNQIMQQYIKSNGKPPLINNNNNNNDPVFTKGPPPPPIQTTHTVVHIGRENNGYSTFPQINTSPPNKLKFFHGQEQKHNKEYYSSSPSQAGFQTYNSGPPPEQSNIPPRVKYTHSPPPIPPPSTTVFGPNEFHSSPPFGFSYSKPPVMTSTSNGPAIIHEYHSSSDDHDGPIPYPFSSFQNIPNYNYHEASPPSHFNSKPIQFQNNYNSISSSNAWSPSYKHKSPTIEGNSDYKSYPMPSSSYKPSFPNILEMIRNNVPTKKYNASPSKSYAPHYYGGGGRTKPNSYSTLGKTMIAPPPIQQQGQDQNLASSDDMDSFAYPNSYYKPTAYTTLGKKMTAPGSSPAIEGQYAAHTGQEGRVSPSTFYKGDSKYTSSHYSNPESSFSSDSGYATSSFSNDADLYSNNIIPGGGSTNQPSKVYYTYKEIRGPIFGGSIHQGQQHEDQSQQYSNQIYTSGSGAEVEPWAYKSPTIIRTSDSTIISPTNYDNGNEYENLISKGYLSSSPPKVYTTTSYLPPEVYGTTTYAEGEPVLEPAVEQNYSNEIPISQSSLSYSHSHSHVKQGQPIIPSKNNDDDDLDSETIYIQLPPSSSSSSSQQQKQKEKQYKIVLVSSNPSTSSSSSST